MNGEYFCPDLMVWQGIIHDGVLGDFRQRDVLRHVLQVGPVILAHDEKLAGVAEHGGADARLFEPGVLLDDGNVPAIEFPKLGVAFLHDFLSTRNVEEAGDLLIHIALSQRARERNDMLARVVRYEEARRRLQLLGRLRECSPARNGRFCR